ncbi:MAG: putative dsRNA-binding protein, partial [Balneolaceae bacterium]
TKGYDMAYRFVERVLEDQIDLGEMTTRIDNYKSLLLEYTQAEKRPLPCYRVISEEGPGHNKTFNVSVTIDDVEYGHGSGKSKKQAEQFAAEMAYRELKKEKADS